MERDCSISLPHKWYPDGTNDEPFHETAPAFNFSKAALMMNYLESAAPQSAAATTTVPAAKGPGGAANGITLDPEECGIASVSRSVKLILLSTDERFCMLVRSYLQHMGFCVFTCTSFDRAKRQFLCRNDIDLWLVDAEALTAEAINFATELRAMHSEVPIVLITESRQGASNMQRQRGQDWLSVRRPIALPDLLATIHRALANTPGIPETSARRGGLDYFENDWMNRLSQNPLMN